MESKRSHPKFKPQNKAPWIGELKQQVQQWVKNNDSRVKNNMHVKAGMMVLCYLLAYGGLLFFSSQLWAMFGWYMLLGICLIILFLNTAHDIAHNTFFRSAKLNRLFLFVFDILGDDHTIWKTRHVNFHHSYSNIQDWDMDIRQTKTVRILPNAVYMKFHRYQHIYMPFLYLFYTIHVSYYRDFYDLFNKNGLMNKHGDPRKKNVPRFIFFKFLNLSHLLLIPMLIIPLAWYLVLSGFIVMHLTGSIIAASALVSAHVGEDAVFMKAGDNNIIPHSWQEHQLITTTDFATNSRVLTYLIGGFNHHVAHHLFPNVSHGHYARITRMICEMDKKYRLNYKSLALGSALLTHFRLLRNNSIDPTELFDE